MYKKSLLLLVFVFLLFLNSCRTSRQEIQKTESQTKVISEKTVDYKDTIVYAPKAETSLKIPLTEFTFKQGLNGVLKPKVYTQKNGQATAKIEINDDAVTITATCDSLAIKAKIRVELQKEYSEKLQATISQMNKKTGFTFFDLLLWSLLAFLLGFVTCLILKFFKIV